MNRTLRPFAVDGLQQQRWVGLILGIALALILVPLLLFLEAGPGASLNLPVGTSIAASAIAGCALWLLSFNERIWVLSAVASLVVFVFRQEEGELGVDVLFFALYAVTGTLLWFIKELHLGSGRIVRSRFDLMFLSTILVCLLTSTIAALVHGADVRTMIRELAAFLLILFYFPVRSILKSDLDVRLLFYSLLFFGVLNGMVNLMNYQERVVESALTFGAVNARSAMNEPLSAVLFSAFFALMLGARTFRIRVLALGGISLFAGLLVLSLSRGPIIATALGCVTILMLLYRRRVARVLVYAVVALGVNVGAAFLILPDFAASIFENIEGRFETVQQISGDQSFSSRSSEYRALYAEFIPASPIIGYGFGVPYRFYDAPFEVTAEPYYTHNGYLSVAFKFGIPAGLLLILILFSPIFRFPYASVGSFDPYRKMILAGALAGLIAMLLINVTSNVLAYYTEIMLLAILLAVFDYLYRTGEEA